MKEKTDKNENALISIAAVTGGILLVITLVFAIFASSDIGLVVPIAWALVLLGIFLGWMQYKSIKGR